MKCQLHMPEGRSMAEELASDPAEREAFISGLTPEEKQRLLYNWTFWARPKQKMPPGHWFLWLILAGRFFGKTRTAVEGLRSLVYARQTERMLIAGPTAADVRDTMIEGSSGLLASFPKEHRPHYEPGNRKVTFHTGAIALCRSAEAEERLRGPEYDTAWLDEFACWPDPDLAWKLLVPSIRLGTPRVVVTTTPRPLQIFRQLLDKETTVFTTGGSLENAGNIPDAALREVVDLYSGTDFGKQEIDGQLLGEVPGALWRQKWIDDSRVDRIPDGVVLRRIVVAVDPSSSAKPHEACEAGIIVAALGSDGRVYVLRDLSGHYTPGEWVRIALKARADHKAGAIVYEANLAGAIVAETFRLIEPGAAHLLKPVQAQADKAARAIPVAARHQKGLICLIGKHQRLEEQLTTWVPRVSTKSPDRLDALVWAAIDLLGIPQVRRDLTNLPPA